MEIPAHGLGVKVRAVVKLHPFAEEEASNRTMTVTPAGALHSRMSCAASSVVLRCVPDYPAEHDCRRLPAAWLSQ